MAEGRERQPHPISIHALREEGDGFLASKAKREQTISIHALREEGDLMAFSTLPS